MDVPRSVTADGVELFILSVRGMRVLLDSDLAALYGVETKVLNQAVKRNIDRFPDDFMFRLSREECADLMSQSVTSSSWGGQRKPPRVFTEQGVAMLSSVLRSHRAIQVNIEIMRAFVRLRTMAASHRQLSRQIAALEEKYDARFREVFEAIRALVVVPLPDGKKIGFHVP